MVDVACVRKYPRNELLGRARAHSKECALMGHCVESGYGQVRDDGGGVNDGQAPEIRAGNLGEVARLAASQIEHGARHAREHIKEGEIAPALSGSGGVPRQRDTTMG